MTRIFFILAFVFGMGFSLPSLAAKDSLTCLNMCHPGRNSGAPTPANFKTCYEACVGYNQPSNSASGKRSTTKKNTTPKKQATTNKQESNQNGNQQNASNECHAPKVRTSNGVCVCPSGMVDYIDDEVGASCRPANPSETAGDDSGSGAGNAACISSFRQDLDKCSQERGSANSDCDGEASPDMQKAKSSVARITSQLGQAVQMQAACSKAAEAIGVANAGVGAYLSICSSSQKSCLSTCQDAKTRARKAGVACFGSEASLEQYLAAVDNEISVCKDFDSRTAEANQSIQNSVQALTSAVQCSQALSAQTNTVAQICQQHPDYPGCSLAKTDCSNPQVAASDPRCNPGIANKPGDLGGGAGGSASMASNLAGGTGSGSGSAGSALDGLGNVGFQGNPNMKPGDGNSEDPGGSKGGRPLMDGGAGGGGAGGQAGGGGAAGDPMSVNSGFWGGGGSGGGAGGYGGGEGGAGGGYAGRPNDPNNPDLRKFLPGQQFDPRLRGVAGMVGPDGVTGPHTDIWKKVKNRYQANTPTLLP